MLLTQTRLRQILGILWLIDGLLQLQPLMFTMNMINGIMVPMIQAQPASIGANLQWIVQVTTEHIELMNWSIAIIQIGIGLCLIFGHWVKPAVIVSIFWAIAVWYAGEGLSMLLTGQGSVLTGAPGSVLLYPLLGLVIYPRHSLYMDTSSTSAADNTHEEGILSRLQLRWILAGFWFFAALLQLQPYWWQSGRISEAIGSMAGQGGLNNFFVDPVLLRISATTANMETPLNIAMIVIFLALGIALALAKDAQIRPSLVLSIVVSLIIWYCAEAFGMILTGMATDFNSGLILVVIALACWPLAHAQVPQRHKPTREIREPVRSGQQV